MDLVFNPEGAFNKHDGNDARLWANLFTHLIDQGSPYYKVMEEGLLLHKGFEETSMEIDDVENVGYVMGFRLVELVKSGMVKRDKAIDLGATYRISWNGFQFYAREIPWVEYRADEPEYVKQNRFAVSLVTKLTKMFRAQEKGVNIRLFFNGDAVKLLELKKEQYGLYTKGMFAELSAMIRQDVTEKAVHNQMRRFEKVAERVAAEGGQFDPRMGSFELRNPENEPVDVASLVGETVALKSGRFTSKVYVVTEENLAVVMATAKRYCLKVEVVKGINVPAIVAES
jgi:hypothetical protein